MALNEKQTTYKITYENIGQFVEDINRNFALLEASPLYKGIPGQKAEDPEAGPVGPRGTKFIFVDFEKFREIFPGELSSTTEVDLNFINYKLGNFQTKISLLKALKTDDLINADIVVLTNSSMLTYIADNDVFIDTGIAFNEQTNLAGNIENQIKQYVEFYLANNPELINLKSPIIGYKTIGKNFADNNNVFVTTDLLSTTVYSPNIPGYSNNSGISITNHKYFGFESNSWEVGVRGTMVVGNIREYYDLVNKTTETGTEETLSSDYAPGEGNIPGMVMLQNAYNAGITFGYKNAPNLKRFGSIYKNEAHELIIKSDQGKKEAEFSELAIHKDYLRFKKLVQFYDDLEVSKALKVFGDFQLSSILRSGQYTTGTTNIHRLEIGSKNAAQENIYVGDKHQFTNFKSRVLTTDSSGNLSKTYDIETKVLNQSLITDLTQLETTPDSAVSLLTSNYYSYLARKINSVTNFVNNNYWKKTDFENLNIPILRLQNALEVRGNVSFTNSNGSTKFFDINSASGLLNIGETVNFSVLTNNINLTQFKEKVLTTDSNGKILASGIIEKTPIDATEILWGNMLGLFNNNSLTNFITTKYYTHLASKINNIQTKLNSDVWYKPDFATGTIPSLYVSGVLKSSGLDIGNSVFKVTGNLIDFGLTTTLTFNTPTIKFNKFLNNVLVTSSDGSLLATYNIESLSYPDSALSTNVQIPETLTSTSNFITSSHLRFFQRKINNILTWIDSTYWKKTDFNSGIIPSLTLSKTISVAESGVFGASSNPNISFNTLTESTIIGKQSGTVQLRGTIRTTFSNSILSTDGNGNIVGTLTKLFSSDDRYGQSSANINNNFWNKLGNGSFNANFVGTNGDSFNSNIIPNGDQVNFMNRVFQIIRTKIYERPTATEVTTSIDQKIAAAIAPMNNKIAALERINAVFSLTGGIVIWDRPANQIPAGWQEYIPLQGRMPMGYLGNGSYFGSLGSAGGPTNGKAYLYKSQMPRASIEFWDAYYIENATSKQENSYPSSYKSINIGTGFSGSGSTDGDNRYMWYAKNYTENMGDGEPLDLMNPYRVVHFIKYVG